MSNVNWPQFPPPYIPEPSSDARTRLRNPVAIRLLPARYRSAVQLASVGLIRLTDDGYAANMAPQNQAYTPEDLARKLSIDPATALVALSMDYRHFDLVNGSAAIEEQRELIVCLFATVQAEQRQLQYFRDATIRHYGQDLGWGTIADLLREYGHDICC